jgi:3-methyladenine DNA glycosylase AlkD
MTRDEIMAQLQAWGNEKARAINIKNGAGEGHFGVNLSNLRTLAKQLKTNQPLAMELWETGQDEAQCLATLIMRPKELTADQLDAMQQSITYYKVGDWLMVNVIKNHPAKEELRLRWLDAPGEYVGRAAWSLTHERIQKGHDLDLPATLDRIEAEMASEPFYKQMTMNFCLIEIGTLHADLRDRAIAIGEKLKVFIDWPMQKGCVSPYAPIAILEMVKRLPVKA